MAMPDVSNRPSVGLLLDAAAEHVERFRAELRMLLPQAVAVVDVHTHLGIDDDGMRADYDELLSTLDDYDVRQAFTFCLNEPDRAPAFRSPNDRTLAHARAAG